MTLAGLVALSLAAGQAGTGLSEEARVFESVEKGRIAEALAFVDTLPADSPCRALTTGPLKRLASLRERLIAAINKGDVAVDLKDVHPDAKKGGRIVGATEGVLKVEDDERVRQLLWGGLPPGVTANLAAAFLKRDISEEPAIRRDLLESLGAADALRDLDPERASDVDATIAFRRALASRSPLEARKALAAREPRKEESPWLTLARLWLKRLDDSLARHDARRKEIAAALPEGAKLHLWEDFEEGPEQVSSAWERGITTVPPEGATVANRWCRRSVFVGKGLGWGEMIDEYYGDARPGDLRAPVCTLEPRLTLTARVWAVNVKQIHLALDSEPSDSGGHYSIIEVPVDRTDAWTRIKVRLDEQQKHKPFTQGFTLPILKMGDPIWRVMFKAHRADPGRDDGFFYLDDLRIVTAAADED